MSADEDVSAKVAIRDWRLLNSSAVGAAERKHQPDLKESQGRARNGLLKAAREIGMVGAGVLTRGKLGIGYVGEGESGRRRGAGEEEG